MYPKYFRNTVTGDIYKFTSENRGCLHEANDNVTRFPSDYDERELAPHNLKSIWEEVTVDDTVE